MLFSREIRPSLAVVGVTRGGAVVHVSWSGLVTRPPVPHLVATHADPATGLVYTLSTSPEGLTLCQIN